MAAPAPIASMIQHIWIVRWHMPDGTTHTAQTLPYPNVHLVIENGQALIHGIHRGRFTRELVGEGGAVGVKFRPGGLFPFWRRSVSLLKNRSVAAEQVFGSAVCELSRDVGASRIDDAFVVRAIERFFVRHWPAPDPNVDQVADIVASIESDRTILKVEDLLPRYACTKRSLQRLFEQYVGIGPKWVINRFRMHEVIERLDRGEPVDWAGFAQDLGYFDQAHFNRDFKSLIGCTPKQYATRA
ncbi:MAG TPA: helix-turn-helix transcriptional regulator [Steroidobacteraceae bacterium]|nr:helix-turn-helix transcriptional regulator [Steroidobacteraceae bacterium]